MDNYENKLSPFDVPISLFFWQYLVIAFVLGIIASRYFSFAFFAYSFLFLLLFLRYLSRKSFRIFFFELIFFVLSFVCAFFYASNSYLRLDEASKLSWDKFNNPMEYNIFIGEIESVQSMPHRRLRLFLKDVSPLYDYKNLAEIESVKNLYELAESDQKTLRSFSPLDYPFEYPKVPKTVSLSWDRSKPLIKRPVSGDTLIFRTRIRENYGAISSYWADKNVWYSAWLYGNSSLLELDEFKKLISQESPEETKKREKLEENTSFFHTLAKVREDLRYNFVKNLFIPKNVQKEAKEFSFDLNSQENQSRAILPALLFGDRFYLNTNTLDLFNGANLLHSLALSGQHLALAGVFGAFFAFICILFFPRILKYCSQKKAIFFASIPFASAYIFIGSAPSSLLRAFIMFLLAGFLWLRAKVFSLHDVLFLALLCFSVFRPSSIFDLGVQLSFTCVFSIAFFMPIIRKSLLIFGKTGRKIIRRQNFFLRRKFQITMKDPNAPTDFSIEGALILLKLQMFGIKILRSIASLFLISAIIQITSFPILVTYFGNVSFFFILNIIWLPALAFIVLPFAAFALLFSYLAKNLHFAQDFLQNLYQKSLNISVYPNFQLLEFLTYLKEQNLDFFIQMQKPSPFFLLAYYVLLFFFIYWKKIPKIAFPDFKKKSFQMGISQGFFAKKTWQKLPLSFAFLLIAFLLFFQPINNYFFKEKNLSLSLLDVGQGQAVLLENSLKNAHIERILVDTGGANSPRFNVGRDIVAHYLTQNNSANIDYIIATHDDSDHINGLGHIIRYFNVSTFFEPYLPRKEKSKTRQDIDKALQRKNTPMQGLGMGDILPIGNGFFLQVLHPPYPLETALPLTPQANKYKELAKPQKEYSSNNSSLVLRLVKDSKGLAILCGDVEADILEDLTRYNKENTWTYNPNSPFNIVSFSSKNTPTQNDLELGLQADILILAHHGSKNSYAPNFYKAVNPHHVLASAGRYNRFDFPNKIITDYFNKKNVNLHVTANDGDIHFKWNGAGESNL